MPISGEKKKSSAPHGAELPSPAGGSRACRTPECTKLCSRQWQLRLCRMRRGALPVLEKKKSSAPHGAELPSPTGGSRACRTPDCAKLCSRQWQLRLCRMRRGALPVLEKKKSSAPHGAELPSPTGGSRACRTPDCAKLCSRRWQLRLCRMRGGALPMLEKKKNSAPHGAELHPGAYFEFWWARRPPSLNCGSIACRTGEAEDSVKAARHLASCLFGTVPAFRR